MIVLMKINKDGAVSLAEEGRDYQVMSSAKTAAEKLALESDDTIVVVESQAMFARRYVVGQIDTRSPPAVVRTPGRDQAPLSFDEQQRLEARESR